MAEKKQRKVKGQSAFSWAWKSKGKAWKGKNDKRGFSLITGLLMFFLALTFLTALVPALVDVISDAKARDSLNCKDAGDYNSTINPNGSGGEVDSISCRAIDLAIPFIVLGVIFGGIMLILYGQRRQEAPPAGYGY